MVHRLTTWRDSAFQNCVLGAAPQPAFANVAYCRVRPCWRAWRKTARYVGGVLQHLQDHPATLIEVHNRPEIALALATALPQASVSLFLHNDPQAMRQARSPAERTRLINALAGVLPVSAYLRDRLLQGLPDHPAGRVRVMPNCLDLASLPPRAVAREPCVLFAGRLVADKGADVFVDAWQQAAKPGWQAQMIGADRFGPNSPETPFLRALRPRAARAGVALLGYQPHDVVLRAMANAAIVVVPSRWPEPFGLTALEAMASGAALIYAKTGALPEVAGPAGIGLERDNPGALAEALNRLIANPDLLASVAQTGLERARDFDLPQAAMRLEAYRQEVLHACRD